MLARPENPLPSIEEKKSQKEVSKESIPSFTYDRRSQPYSYFEDAISELNSIKMQELIESYPSFDFDEISRYTGKPNAYISSLSNKSQYSLLMLAASISPSHSDNKKEISNQLSIIEMMLEKKADVNYVNEYGTWGIRLPKRTALMIAAEKQNADVIKKLLEYKADVNYTNYDTQTALTIAIEKYDATSVKTLLKFRADPNHTANPLLLAMYRDNVEVMKLLLEHDANVDYALTKARPNTKIWDLLNEYKIKHFIAEHKDNIQLIDGEYYALTKRLEGRGQEAAAGFYIRLADKKSYLIKQDDPYVCVLESTADWTEKLLPTHFTRKVINFAHCGVLTSNSYDKTSHVVSIQPAIDAKPWDIIILGKKRRPKIPVSEECLYQDKIKKHLSELSDDAKTDVACALFLRTAAGDESLHIGQYLAFTDEKTKNVTGLIGIDLGARERFALARKASDDFKHQTSQFYLKSGQYCKDYIYYLLQDNDVNNKDIYMRYYYLWGRLTHGDVMDAVLNSLQSFRKQMDRIPEDQKADILKNIYDNSYAQGLSEKETGDITQKRLEKIIAKVVEKRLMMMHLSARSRIEKMLLRMEKNEKIFSEKTTDNDSDSDNDHESKLNMDYFYSTINISIHQDEMEDELERIHSQFSLLAKKEITQEKENEILSDCMQYLAFFKARILFDDIKTVNSYYFFDKSKEKTYDKIKIIKHLERLQIKLNIIKILREYPYSQAIIRDAIIQLAKKKDPRDIIPRLLRHIPKVSSTTLSIYSNPFIEREKLTDSLGEELRKYYALSTKSIQPSQDKKDSPTSFYTKTSF